MIDQNNENNLEISDSGKEDKHEWYYRPWVICGAILCFGPLGLFPLWSRPKTSPILKIIVSVIVLAATVIMTKGAVVTYQNMSEYYQELAETLK